VASGENQFDGNAIAAFCFDCFPVLCEGLLRMKSNWSSACSTKKVCAERVTDSFVCDVRRNAARSACFSQESEQKPVPDEVMNALQKNEFRISDAGWSASLHGGLCAERRGGGERRIRS